MAQSAKFWLQTSEDLSLVSGTHYKAGHGGIGL